MKPDPTPPTTPISIEVTLNGTKSYLAIGSHMNAIDAVSGEPLDLFVSIDRGILAVRKTARRRAAGFHGKNVKDVQHG